MHQDRIATRNTDQAILYEGSMGSNFRSKVGDLKEMTHGFIQAFYSGHDALDGVFELFVSGYFCGDDDLMARYPCSEFMIDAGCNSLGWNLVGAGYRYVQIRYTANSVTTGTVKIKAIGKRG